MGASSTVGRRGGGEPRKATICGPAYHRLMSIWFGFHLPSFTHPDTPPDRLFDRVVEQAQAAEVAGFDLVTVMDHLYQIGGVGQPDEPMLEGWLGWPPWPARPTASGSGRLSPA